jgi:hypothetical protein
VLQNKKGEKRACLGKMGTRTRARMLALAPFPPFWSAAVTSRVKKIGRIFRNSTKTGGIGPVRIPKPSNLLFTVSKFQKKIKVSKKYKKTRSNSKVTSEEIFVKLSRLNW